MIFEFRYKHRTGDTRLCEDSCEKDGSVVDSVMSQNDGVCVCMCVRARAVRHV